MPISFDDLIPQQSGAVLGTKTKKPGMFDDIPVERGPWTDFQRTGAGVNDWQPVQQGGVNDWQPVGRPWEDFQRPANRPGMFDDLIPAQGQTPPMSGTRPVDNGRPFTLMDTWPARLAQSIYNAVTLPGDVYQGNATVPQSANMPGGENTENIGRVTDLAALTALPSEAGGLTKTAAPSLGQLKSAAQASYDAANKIGIELKPQALHSFNTNLQAKLGEDGLNAEVAPKTFSVLNKLSAVPADSTVTAPNLRTIQKSLGVVKNTSIDPTERMTAGRALNEFNNLLENIDQVPSAIANGTPEDAAQFSNLVKEANANYTAYKQGAAFEQRGDVAENNTAASHSGMNLENNLRSQVRAILNNPKLQRGYDPDTLQAMRQFNAGSRTANTMRMLGNLMGGGGGLGMLAAGSVSHLLGLPFELGPGIGLGLKSMANQRAMGGFNNIGNMIRANSPLAQSGVVSRLPANGLGFLGRTLLPVPLEAGNQPPQ